MLRTPVPIVGTRAIERVARAVERLPAAGDTRQSLLFVGHLVRMQEEIGTGGGGFRFMYASFLEEAAALTRRPALAEQAARLVEIGDGWREFALAAARMIRGRDAFEPAALAALLRRQAADERAFFGALEKALA